ncbi:MAG: right-handed parallel beta-helix repeat-containing protein [Verrucomicrobiae bacterium]|nr:right-handed parallel beta-helix repeat-containing protein [Verrucomicrobiae bacterium]NNJ43037.1 DUF1565 domain-containing protein [Akkermansiaceae bacterium]
MKNMEARNVWGGLLVVLFLSASWWGYHEYQKRWNAYAENEADIAQLQAVGRDAVREREWRVANETYQKIEELDPHSSIAAAGLESIKRGKKEELSQQVFYTLGESQAAVEAGRWTEAETLAMAVLKLTPGNKSALRKLDMIAEGRLKQEISLKMRAITDALDHGEWAEAERAFAQLQVSDPQNPNLQAFAERISVEKAKLKRRLDKALTLYQQALKLDIGKYSPEAMSLVHEAMRLHPDSPEIKALHQKMTRYTRSIHVPGDFPTITRALEVARPRDVIRIAPGTYKESIVIDKPIHLEATAEGDVILEWPSKDASIITITPDAMGSQIHGLTIKHLGFDHRKDRFSGITIEAKDVTVSGCHIRQSAGHGVAVVGGGKTRITGCKITGCGWDGIAAYGVGSHVTVVDTLSQGNLQHGTGFWLGGSGSVINSRMLKNGLCGVVAMSQGIQVTIKSTTCSQNREAGILVAGGVTATLDSNRCEKNQLSGIVVRGDGTSVSIVNNRTSANGEVGILTHLGVKVSRFAKNKAHNNARRQIWRDARLKK